MKDIPSLILFFIEIAWRRRYLIVLPLMIFPVLALIAGRMTPKTYEAQTTILVQETAKLNPFLNDLAVGPKFKRADARTSDTRALRPHSGKRADRHRSLEGRCNAFGKGLADLETVICNKRSIDG